MAYMISTVIELVKETGTQNEYGAFIYEESKRTVFAEVTSVSMSEFYEGGRAGLNPAYRFLVIAGDYENEDIIIYDGKRYSVYRTYETSDHVELYVELRAGA